MLNFQNGRIFTLYSLLSTFSPIHSLALPVRSSVHSVRRSAACSRARSLIELRDLGRREKESFVDGGVSSSSSSLSGERSSHPACETDRSNEPRIVGRAVTERARDKFAAPSLSLDCGTKEKKVTVVCGGAGVIAPRFERLSNRKTGRKTNG